LIFAIVSLTMLQIGSHRIVMKDKDQGNSTNSTKITNYTRDHTHTYYDVAHYGTPEPVGFFGAIAPFFYKSGRGGHFERIGINDGDSE